MRGTNDARHVTWLAIVFALSLPLVTARIYASDEVEGFAWLHSLAFDGDVSFENEYEYFYQSGQVKNPSFHETFLEDRRTGSGLRPNFTTMGAAILWAPFYAAGHVAAHLTGRPADGLSQPYVTAVAIGSATYGFLTLLLSIAMARHIAGAAVWPAVAVWVGSPLVFYMYVTPLFTHACSAFAVALFLWTWLEARDEWTPGGAAMLGLTGGLMTIVRAQDALFIAGPALDFLRVAVRRRRESHATGAGGWLETAAALLRPATAGAFGFLIVYTPQLLAFRALNGRFHQSEYELRKMTWTAPHGLQVLLDPQHGLFFWTPLAVLAIIGLVRLAATHGTSGTPSRPAGIEAHQEDIARIHPASFQWSDARWLGVVCLIMVALQAYIAGSVESWTVAGAFGQRRFVSLTPLIVLGLSVLTSTLSRERAWPRAMVTALVVLCVWWNLGLMAQFGLHTMDRERLTLRANAWQSFVTLPLSAPSLIWRYVTDRSSFFNQPRQ